MKTKAASAAAQYETSEDTPQGAGKIASAGGPDRELSAAEAPGVAAVNRAIQILNAFDASSDGLSLTEISKRTGFFKSTVFRLSESLLEYGLLERGKDSRFHLGRELIRLGVLAKRTWGPSQHIQNALQSLTDESGESSTYYVRQGNGRLAMFRVDSPKSVRDNIKAGDVLPIDRGAAGHILAGTGGTRAQFEVVISRGERDAEVAAVACAVYSESRLIGALSVSGPRSRMTEAKIRQISGILSKSCAELTEYLS